MIWLSVLAWARKLPSVLRLIPRAVWLALGVVAVIAGAWVGHTRAVRSAAERASIATRDSVTAEGVVIETKAAHVSDSLSRVLYDTKAVLAAQRASASAASARLATTSRRLETLAARVDSAANAERLATGDTATTLPEALAAEARLQAQAADVFRIRAHEADSTAQAAISLADSRHVADSSALVGVSLQAASWKSRALAAEAKPRRTWKSNVVIGAIGSALGTVVTLLVTKSH